MREDDIRAAIERLPGVPFERFARELLRRMLYPGLNPTSTSHDMGEDARTEASTVIMHGGRRVSIGCSKTSTLDKIRTDCRTCKRNGQQIDIMVFTTSGAPRETTIYAWKRAIKSEFGWDLEVRTIEWLAPAANEIRNEDLVNDYLYIPPPGGDHWHHVDAMCQNETQQYLRRIDQHVTGIPNPIYRQEVNLIEEQLALGRSIVVTGDAGTGKSVIGAQLATLALAVGKSVLFVDARRVRYVRSEADLRRHLSLNGAVHEALSRLGRFKGCRLIIDQLDSAAGQQSAFVLLDLALDCVKAGAIQVVVISRNREAREAKLLTYILEKGSDPISVPLLDSGRVIHLLQQIGVVEPPTEIIELGRNLLNLDLIGRTAQQHQAISFANVTDEVDLWEGYLSALTDREGVDTRAYDPELLVGEAVRLATISLRSENGIVCLDYPLSHEQRRLESWGVIRQEEAELHYRFGHEKLPDFLYAWNAAKSNKMPDDVIADLGPFRSANVLLWLERMYAKISLQVHMRFLEVMFNVQ